MLPILELRSKSGRSTARVSSFGARLIDWTFEGQPHLFMPQAGAADEVVAPHGGVPVLFPQFGLFGPGRKHGVVRDRDWRVEEQGESFCLLRTRLRGEDGDFDVFLRVDLHDDGPDLSFSAVNVGTQAQSFTAGLHTYLRVPNIETTLLEGLEAVAYEDALQNLTPVEPAWVPLTAPVNVDRVYAATPRRLQLRTPDFALLLEQSGFHDTVVWNPGPEIAKTFADLNDGEWRTFLCVEAAQIRPPVTLGPMDTWYGTQKIRRLAA